MSREEEPEKFTYFFSFSVNPYTLKKKKERKKKGREK
jgi:hypothetical protein